jgi:hypothetical protein
VRYCRQHLRSVLQEPPQPFLRQIERTNRRAQFVGQKGLFQHRPPKAVIRRSGAMEFPTRAQQYFDKIFKAYR